jgi:hypothetical protein
LPEFVGKQDPYVKLSLGTNWKVATDVKMNGGKDVSWTNLKISKELSLSQLSRDDLRVAVFDKNKSRSDVELGSGQVTVRSVLSSPNSWVALRGDLLSGKAPCGQFQIKGRFNLQGSRSNNDLEIAKGDHSEPIFSEGGPRGGNGSTNGSSGSGSSTEDMKKLLELMSGQKDQVDRKMGGVEDTLKRQMQTVGLPPWPD